MDTSSYVLPTENHSEKKLTVVAFLYFFFIISAYYVLKPVRESLALEFGAKNVNVLKIISMFSLIVVNAVYSMIIGSMKRDKFIPGITKFFIGSIVVFWGLFNFAIPLTNTHYNPNLSLLEQMSLLKIIVYGGFYLWVNMFSVVAVSMFWSFINDIFTVEQGKKYYAYVGYGGLIGGMTGSYITKLIVKRIGAIDILLVAAIILTPTLLCFHYILTHFGNNNPDSAFVNNYKNKKTVNPTAGFLSVKRNPILIFMAFEMLFYTCSATFFAHQLNHIVDTQLEQGTFASLKDAKTAFFADLYWQINIVSLVTQLLVTQLIMLLKIPVYGLLILNFIQVAGSILLASNTSTLAPIVIAPITIVSWTIVIRSALDYSTARVLRESVYIPLDKDAKYQGKGFIDTVLFRIGGGLSSTILVFGLDIWGYGNWIDFSILFVMLLQFYVIIKAASLYGEKLQSIPSHNIETVSA